MLGSMEKSPKLEMRWKVCPASMHPKKAVFGWAIILFFGFFIASNSIILGVALTTLLVATQATFLFPTTFTIDEEGLRAKYPIRRKFYSWSSIRRVQFFKEACYLFTRKKPSKLDSWSGIPVFYGVEKEEVVAAIKAHLDEDIAK